MWLCLQNGLLSVVADRSSPSRLVIRARRRKVLEEIFPNVEITVSEQADYKYRVLEDRETFAKLVAKITAQVQYFNFKSSVEDPDLYELYERFWEMHQKYGSSQ